MWDDFCPVVYVVFSVIQRGSNFCKTYSFTEMSLSGKWNSVSMQYALTIQRQLNKVKHTNNEIIITLTYECYLSS